MEGIFSTVKGLVSKSINTIDEITTLDEKKWKKRAMMGISTIQSTLTSEPVLAKKTHEKKNVFLEAGSDLLYKYELEWTKIHHANQVIVARAVEVDANIIRVLKVCQDNTNQYNKFLGKLGEIPKIRAEITKINSSIGLLSKRFLELESLADELELLAEKKNTRIWEKQQAHLHNEYVSLKSREVKAKEFLMKKERETFEAALNAEKQQIAQEAFQQDLETFMKDPKPRSMSTTSAISNKSMDEELKEILDKLSIDDESEQKELSEFLAVTNESQDQLLTEKTEENETDEKPVEVLPDVDYSGEGV